MIDFIDHKEIPDDEIVFYDGFLYIISSFDNGEETKCEIEFIILCPEYDDPLSLVDIQNKYPNVSKVIFEDWLKGSIYNYGNHRKDKIKLWEKVGTTVGFA